MFHIAKLNEIIFFSTFQSNFKINLINPASKSSCIRLLLYCKSNEWVNITYAVYANCFSEKCNSLKNFIKSPPKWIIFNKCTSKNEKFVKKIPTGKFNFQRKIYQASRFSTIDERSKEVVHLCLVLRWKAPLKFKVWCPLKQTVMFTTA